MHLARIAIAPVKGLGLQHPEFVNLTTSGVPGDRRFALVDERGHLANGKRIGPLVRVRAQWIENPEALVLTLPDGSQVGGEIELGEPLEPIFYGEPRPARLVLGDYAASLSDLAGQPVRLVQLPTGEGIDRPGTGGTSLQTTASLEALGNELDAPVDDRRFRMTFTIAGAGPHEEDAWIGRPVRIGAAVVIPEGNIGRCAVTTQNPDTGVPDLRTLKAIAHYRGEVATTEPLPFGVHARVLVPGRVTLGEPVSVE